MTTARTIIARLQEREKIVRKLADELPDIAGITYQQKLEKIRLEMAALEAENTIKNFLPYLRKIKNESRPK